MLLECQLWRQNCHLNYMIYIAAIGPKLPLIFSRFYLADRLSESR